MSQLLNVPYGSSRAALISYGTHSQIVFPLRGSDDAQLFSKAVDLAQYIGGERRLDRVLPSVTQLLSNARPQARIVNNNH